MKNTKVVRLKPTEPKRNGTKPEYWLDYWPRKRQLKYITSHHLSSCCNPVEPSNWSILLVSSRLLNVSQGFHKAFSIWYDQEHLLVRHWRSSCLSWLGPYTVSWAFLAATFLGNRVSLLFWQLGTESSLLLTMLAALFGSSLWFEPLPWAFLRWCSWRSPILLGHWAH